MGRQMQVYVRLFPLPNRDWKYLQISKDLKDIFIQSSVLSSSHAQLLESFAGKPVDKFVRFRTSGIFVNNTQEELYRIISQDIFSKVFRGENVIIMANGQHNSGKTFTMTGYTGLYENRGVTLRLIEDLIQEIEMRKNHLRIEVYVSHIDFAAETMIDLMTEPASNLSNFNQAKKLKVKNKEQLIKSMILSEKRRWVEGISTHCLTSVFTIYLKCSSKVKSEPYDYYPRIQLVELCGVETAKTTKSCQQKSNKDMAAMSLYLATRGSGGPLRSASRLVSFLGDTWNSSFIRVICHLKPCLEKRNLNMSTLLFTSRLMQRPLYALSLQRVDNPAHTLHYALEMIQRLEEELLVREMIVGDGFRHVGTVSQREMDSVLCACDDFLEEKMSIEALLSTAHPHILIRAFKNKFETLSAKAALNKVPSNLSTGPSIRMEKMSPKISISKKRLGVPKKARPTIEVMTMEMPRSNHSYDITSVDLKHPQEIPDRLTIEAEFYTRYPDQKTQLDLANENYYNALRIRDEVYEEYGKIKKEAAEEKRLEEEFTWKKRLELGECVAPDGIPLWATFNEKPAQEAAQIARKDTIEALHAFTTARDTLTELKANIEEKIQEYMETAYGLWTPTIDAEDPKICYVEKQDLQQEPQEQTPGDRKIQDLFYLMQKSTYHSSPFQKKANWI